MRRRSRAGTGWAGVFCTADTARRYRVPRSSTALDARTEITELWSGERVEPDPSGDLVPDLSAHGVALLRTT